MSLVTPIVSSFRPQISSKRNVGRNPCGLFRCNNPSQASGMARAPAGRLRASQASGGYGPSVTSQKREAQLNVLRQELKKLEDERDEAVRTAESSAKTCVRLTDMSRLLEDLALEKVKAGDEAGAKLVLQEKNSLKEIIEKSNSKAQANFALAGKLATLIGDKHNELLAVLGSSGTAAASGSAAAPGSYTPGPWDSAAGSWPPEQPSTSASPSYGSSTVTGGGGGSYQLPWERSLAEARQRVRQAEAEAQRMGRLAALSAEDSIAAARERLRAQRDAAASRSSEDVLQARERLRRTAEESIAEARERLRAQDAQILEYCRRIVARYRRGEYVSEDELEFAFDQLEKRLL